MKLKKNICEDCCKGKRISELDEKVDIQGTEYIPFQEGNDNGKFSLGSLKDYLTKLIEEYLINNGIIREDWVQSEPAFKLLATLPELIADRACKDEFGNNINDTYLTREAVKAYVQSIYEDLFTENPPHIMDGYITVDMLSEAVLQLLNSGGAITNFPDEEDLTVKDGKLKFKDKVYDPNNYSGMGRTILRKNMVDGVNVLTQEMMSEPNVIYVIQYDYDLRGETIVVPDNSILWYQGGSLNNGHITSYDEDRLIIWGNLNGDIEIDIDVSLVGAPADEEDITTESGVLKFKDKEYDTASFSGLGRKYLRKNILNGKNILTQEMINSANTRYIIQYDYDLGGETITVPEGCVLQFEGGSLSNGTLSGNNTTITANMYHIFDTSMTFSGTWLSDKVYPRWFGAVEDGIADDTESLQKALDFANLSLLELRLVGNYLISDTLNVGFFQTIIGEDRSSFYNRCKITQSENKNVFALHSSSNCRVCFKNFMIQSAYNGEDIDNAGIYAGTDNTNGFGKCLFESIMIYGFKYGIKVETAPSKGFYDNVFFKVDCQNNVFGIWAEGNTDSWINANTFNQCYMNANSVGGVVFKGFRQAENNLFINCVIEKCGTDYKLKDKEILGVAGFAFYINNISFYGSTRFYNCYIEGNYPRRTDNLSYNSSKEYLYNDTIYPTDIESNAVFYCYNGSIEVASCRLSTFILLGYFRSPSFIIENNDYTINNIDYNNSENKKINYLFLIDIPNITYPYNTIKIHENTARSNFQNSMITSVLKFTEVSSRDDIRNINIDVVHPLLPKDIIIRNKFISSAIYVDGNSDVDYYYGLTPTNPINSNSHLNHRLRRGAINEDAVVYLLSDYTPSDTLTIENTNIKSLVIEGNSHTLYFGGGLVVDVPVDITINDAIIELRNVNSASTITVSENIKLSFNNCTFIYRKGLSSQFLLNVFKQCQVNFNSCKFTIEDYSEQETYYLRVLNSNRPTIYPVYNNCTIPDNIKLVKTNQSFYKFDSTEYVSKYAGEILELFENSKTRETTDICYWDGTQIRNHDGTLISKVIII